MLKNSILDIKSFKYISQSPPTFSLSPIKIIRKKRNIKVNTCLRLFFKEIGETDKKLIIEKKTQ